MTARVMDAAQQQHHQKMQMQMAENNDSSSCFNNLTTITTMKEQYQNHHGPNSPSLAKELNASGMEIVRRQHEQRDGSAHAHDGTQYRHGTRLAQIPGSTLYAHFIGNFVSLFRCQTCL